MVCARFEERPHVSRWVVYVLSEPPWHVGFFQLGKRWSRVRSSFPGWLVFKGDYSLIIPYYYSHRHIWKPLSSVWYNKVPCNTLWKYWKNKLSKFCVFSRAAIFFLAWRHKIYLFLFFEYFPFRNHWWFQKSRQSCCCDIKVNISSQWTGRSYTFCEMICVKHILKYLSSVGSINRVQKAWKLGPPKLIANFKATENLLGKAMLCVPHPDLA